VVEQAQDREQRLKSAMALGASLLEVLETFESTLRQLHPPRIPELQMYLRGPSERLRRALENFEEVIAADPEESFRGFEQRLCDGARAGLRATRLFAEAGRAGEGIGQILGAMQQHCVAQEAVFSLRRSLRPFSQFFLEPFARDRREELDPESSSVSTGAGLGIQDARNARELRGGFSLYVPESYQGQAWPLVVALHGGSGHGADFLWTWLREARSRQFLLLAPTAQGSTWSFQGPDVDAYALSSMLAFVQERWKVDSDRILLTGLSDGATYSLLCGLQEGMPFTAMAPVSGVLHPANFENGNLDRAAGRRIYLVHGVLDWMFPIESARVAAEELASRGADLVFREIDDLSHTYPREQNAKILDWFLASSG
jgi:phospholipase/carboxylesterase